MIQVQDRPHSSLVALRPYLPQDLDAIVHLDRRCFSESFRFSPSEMRRFAEAPSATTLIAEIDSSLAGFIIVESRRRREASTYVVTLDVAAEHSRQGIGTTLLNAAEAVAAQAAGSQMTLHVHTQNTGAIAFYEDNGYRQTARLRNFYREVADGGDAFLYKKSL